MRVLYDHQIFTSQRYGGISRYFFELIQQYMKDPKIRITLSVNHSDNIYYNEIKSLHPEILNRKSNLFRNLPALMRNYFGGLSRGKLPKPKSFNQLYSLQNIAGQNFDVFHPTYYNPYFLAPLGNKPFVLTIHDMIHERFPHLFDKKDKTAEQKAYLATHAACIIAVSETTRRDIIDILGIPQDRVVAVYHGTSFPVVQCGIPSSSPPILSLPDRYFLFVGHRGSYKNFPFFIQSVSALLKQDHQLMIICAGGPPFYQEEKAMFRNLNMSNKIFYVPADDSTLIQLYTQAIALVVPSLYEGFGMSVLEAFSCGCPVALSSGGSLPEIGKDAAVYFVPTDADTLRTSLQRLLYDKNLRENLRNRGFERLSQFSWEKAAEQTKGIYKKFC